MPLIRSWVPVLAGLAACTPAAQPSGSGAATPVPTSAATTAASAVPPTTADARWIRGHVVGHDGAAPDLTAVALENLEVLGGTEAFPLAADGAFALAVPDDAGTLVALRIDATDHASLTLPVDLRDPDISLEIRLGTAERPTGELKALVAGVRVEDNPWGLAEVGSVTPHGMSPAVPLQRGADGIWTGSAPAQGDRALFVLMTDRGPTVMPSGSGPYVAQAQAIWATAPVQGGRATPRVDLRRLPAPGVAPQVTVVGEGTEPLVRARLSTLAWGPADSGQPPADAATCERAASQARGEDAAVWVYYAGFASARGCAIAGDDASAALQKLAIDDMRWGLAGGAVAATIEALPADRRAEGEAYETALIDRHPNAQLVGDLLLARLRAAGADKARARALRAQLRDKRFARTLAPFIAMYMDPDRLDVGAPTPDFSIPALGDGPPVTRASLLGRPHVLEFWGTWCHPCVDALPEMHAELARLHGAPVPADAAGWRGLTLPGASPVQFVSISVHEPASAVEQFRREQWPMPWLHGVAGPGSQAVMDSFSVGGVPAVFFVDASGVVVQRDGEFSAGLGKLLAGRKRGRGAK